MGSDLFLPMTSSHPSSHFLASRLLHLSLSFAAVAGVNAEPLWPEFRGPTAQGHSVAKGLPVEWAADKNVLWRSELPGLAWSSPIVANGKIFITNAIGINGGDPAVGASLRVLALDATTGKVVWDTEVFQQTNASALKMHKKNSHASPSVVYEQGRLWAHFGHHGTACIDESGKVLWTNREHSFKPVHGTGGCPVIVDDLLIFNHDANMDPSVPAPEKGAPAAAAAPVVKPAVVALDKNTGKTVWRVDRPDTEAKSKFSFSTPLVIEVAGQKQVITPGSGVVQALNPKDGSEIWRAYYGTGYSVVPRPVFAHGMVFLSSGYDKPVGYAIKADGNGDVTSTHVAWTADKRVPHNPSMLVVGDELYMLDDKGMLSSRDARTGVVHYEERLLGPTSSSLLFADGHIYAIDELGASAVVKPGKTLEVIARSELKEKTQASMAVCDNDLLIRTEKAVYRIGKR